MSPLLPNETLLGREVEYPRAYDRKLLFPIERATNRQGLERPGDWYGADIWNAYEVSWLNARGLPQVALARFIVPADSPRLIESKSFKLYLNSLNEERYERAEDVVALLKADLSEAAGAAVNVWLESDLSALEVRCAPLPGTCLDKLDITIDRYEPDPALLQRMPGNEQVSETLVSNLLKSNCPVTGQPDWGSVQVSYTGPRINHESLLKYIVSFRRHTEFHEHCVERMYCDLWEVLEPQSLFVMARYTRRGGLDINPWRSSHPVDVADLRTPRQ
ncbi:MAG TPA: NADPH-dependent 7-cyano-7-deazaguanine reductase QueF [Burkholderiaceae bacterium]|nr:NADPH-dependent 7-cyano-7-deazaguanine reductase QueF [Anaerolineales bacterium]HLV27497.1 NADPH-dependent 7-cyano-7-deazaguanine reductase QueF [Burkholderiaceae bacterium]